MCFKPSAVQTIQSNAIGVGCVEWVSWRVFNDLPQLLRHRCRFFWRLMLVFNHYLREAVNELLFICQHLISALFSNVFYCRIAVAHINASVVQSCHFLFLVEQEAARHFVCLYQFIKRLDAVCKRFAFFKCLIHWLEAGANSSNECTKLRYILRLVLRYSRSRSCLFTLVDTKSATFFVYLPSLIVGWTHFKKFGNSRWFNSNAVVGSIN